MIKIVEESRDQQVAHLPRGQLLLVISACPVAQPQYMQSMPKIMVGVLQVGRIVKQRLKVVDQITFVKFLLIADDHGEITGDLAGLHASLPRYRETAYTTGRQRDDGLRRR
jgi:hypothetical protein